MKDSSSEPIEEEDDYVYWRHWNGFDLYLRSDDPEIIYNHNMSKKSELPEIDKYYCGMCDEESSKEMFCDKCGDYNGCQYGFCRDFTNEQIKTVIQFAKDQRDNLKLR